MCRGGRMFAATKTYRRYRRVSLAQRRYAVTSAIAASAISALIRSRNHSEFLKHYPEYDGRGIKIAIIDSDIVDKNLPGMQKTSTGLPKIINCIGSKSGITVNTSTIVKSNGKNVIIVSSGREIIIPPEFKNPSDKWYIGCTTFEQLYEDDEDDVKCEGKENLKEINVPNMDKKMLPPINDEIVDCIVWFDGEKWQACINTSFSTNLIHMKILTNFDGEYEIAYLPNNWPYCVYVHDEGNSLQILRPPDDHGTLVSHVAAAYFPDNPKSNGLAPGAQIISIRYSGDIEKDVKIFGINIVLKK
uniref:Peptidase S8/S53 domain-containing protein n=1 Tax=Panagrolaimus davidi TaxID=227884 RepID=A0A914P5Y6_9BILA